MFWLIEVHLLDFWSQPWKWVVLVWCSPTPIFHIDFEKYNLPTTSSTKIQNVKTSVFSLFSKKIHSQNYFFDFLNFSFFRPFVVEKQILKGLFFGSLFEYFFGVKQLLKGLFLALLYMIFFLVSFWVILLLKVFFLVNVLFWVIFWELFWVGLLFWGLFWVTLFAQDTFLRKPSFLRTFKSLFFSLYFFEDFKSLFFYFFWLKTFIIIVNIYANIIVNIYDNPSGM